MTGRGWRGVLCALALGCGAAVALAQTPQDGPERPRGWQLLRSANRKLAQVERRLDRGKPVDWKPIEEWFGSVVKQDHDLARHRKRGLESIEEERGELKRRWERLGKSLPAGAFQDPAPPSPEADARGTAAGSVAGRLGTSARQKFGALRVGRRKAKSTPSP